MAAATAPPVTEADWQAQVLDLAHALGWETMHVRRSIGRGQQWTTATSVVGWPDLVLWHETQRRVLFVELKTDNGRATDEQLAVLRSLSLAGAETHLWRPRHLDHIAVVLRGAGR